MIYLGEARSLPGGEGGESPPTTTNCGSGSVPVPFGTHSEFCLSVTRNLHVYGSRHLLAFARPLHAF